MAIIRNATVISVTSNTATVYIDEDGQLPATSVTVYLYTNNSHSGTAAATSITDSAGNATFTGLTPQTTYWVYEANLTTYPSLTTTPAIVQLQNKSGDNIYPVTLDSGKATITMTNVDPGEGAALQENHFIAVYGDATKIQTDDIAGGAVTSDKIDSATLANWEIFYTYEQEASQASGEVLIDIPVDLVTYRRIKIEAADEPNSGINTTTYAAALNSSKNALSTFQMGYEVWGSTFSHINRSSTEVIAYGQYGVNSTMVNIDIFRAGSVNYPTFIAQAFGGSDTSLRYAQNFMGRITSSPSAIKYIRIIFKAPQKGGWVKAYRLKE